MNRGPLGEIYLLIGGSLAARCRRRTSVGEGASTSAAPRPTRSRRSSLRKDRGAIASRASDRADRTIPDGVIAVEIGLDSPQPQVVRPRTPADYAASGSPLAAARRKERQASELVQALREKMRVVERSPARKLDAVASAVSLATRTRVPRVRRPQ